MGLTLPWPPPHPGFLLAWASERGRATFLLGLPPAQSHLCTSRVTCWAGVTPHFKGVGALSDDPQLGGVRLAGVRSREGALPETCPSPCPPCRKGIQLLRSSP